MGRGAWEAAVHEVAKSRTRLSAFTFTFHFYALEKELATHSSVLAWRILGEGPWWAAVYGVAQSQTRLKQLSSSSSNKLLIFFTFILYYFCLSFHILECWHALFPLSALPGMPFISFFHFGDYS